MDKYLKSNNETLYTTYCCTLSGKYSNMPLENIEIILKVL